MNLGQKKMSSTKKQVIAIFCAYWNQAQQPTHNDKTKDRHLFENMFLYNSKSQVVRRGVQQKKD